MKTFVALFSLTFGHLTAQACDLNLQKFPDDCEIQDRFRAVKNHFAAKQINVDEIAEYRAIRFVDRANWNRAKEAFVKPKDIYEPAPDTWLVWDIGINKVMTAAGGKDGLFGNFVLNEETIATINHDLLMNEGMNVKDKISDQTLKPGQYRKQTSVAVGFRPGRMMSDEIDRSEKSMDRFQQAWEAKMGMTFSQLLKDAGAKNFSNAHFRSEMTQNSDTKFVSYTPSREVAKEMEWITQFIKMNLDLYKKGTPVLSPMELAAIVQKWFVSVHPFSDGNGRTSRAIQDIILTNFDMPVVPGGDLQDDATAVYEDYIKETYDKTKKILSALELCQDRNASAFQCQTVARINAMENTKAEFKKKKRKKD